MICISISSWHWLAYTLLLIKDTLKSQSFIYKLNWSLQALWVRKISDLMWKHFRNSLIKNIQDPTTCLVFSLCSKENYCIWVAIAKLSWDWTYQICGCWALWTSLTNSPHDPLWNIASESLQSVPEIHPTCFLL